MAEWTQAGGRDQLMGTLQDITEPKVSDDKLSRLANFDTLTGLPNRYLFKDRLSQAMLKAAARLVEPRAPARVLALGG